MRKSRDIETALYNWLTEDSYSASAHVVPASLGSLLPHVHVVRTGGYEKDMVIEINRVDFDVYAGNAADAMEEASELCGWIRALAGDRSYTAEVTTLPYNNPDPRHPNIARATVKAELVTRVIEERSNTNA